MKAMTKSLFPRLSPTNPAWLCQRMAGYSGAVCITLQIISFFIFVLVFYINNNLTVLQSKSSFSKMILGASYVVFIQTTLLDTFRKRFFLKKCTSAVGLDKVP